MQQPLPHPILDPASVRTRDTHLYELVVEQLFKEPFPALVERARAQDACDDIDLLQMGRRVYLDMVRVARGELSDIHVPNRLPRRGEYQA